MQESQFLANIRGALSQYSTLEEARVLAENKTPTLGPSPPLEEKILRFIQEVGELHKVQILQARDWTEAREKLTQVLTKREIRSIALAGKDLEPRNPIWSQWSQAKDLASVEKAQAGIIQADFGLAETGSVVLLATPEKPRIASLLPPVCYFVLPVSAILDSMGRLMEELRSLHGKGNMPSVVNVVTGPSRTADIELSLTVGVHGPGEVNVVLVG